MSANTEAADRLTAAFEAARWKLLVTATWRTLLWFALPFLAMWSAGLSVETAARGAVCPALAMGMVIAAIHWGGAALAAFTAAGLKEGR